MKMDKCAASGNDEFFTPAYAIAPLMPFIQGKFTHAWCPFDVEESQFVQVLQAGGLTVTHSHIQNGQDFFETEIPFGVDCIISNPPYSKKGEVLRRLFDLGKPFAMLVSAAGLFESAERFSMFEVNTFEILHLDKRVSYFTDYRNVSDKQTNPPFASVYVCSKILPWQICFARINKKDK